MEGKVKEKRRKGKKRKEQKNIGNAKEVCATKMGLRKLNDLESILYISEWVFTGCENVEGPRVVHRVRGQVEAQVLWPRDRVDEVEEQVHGVLLVQRTVLRLQVVVLSEK